MVHGHGPSPFSFYSKLKPGNGTALSDFNLVIIEANPIKLGKLQK